MEKEPAHVQAGSQKHEKRHRRAIILIVLLCLAGWVAYMLTSQEPAVMVLPGGTTITFLEVADGEKKGALHGNRSGQGGYIHARVIKESTLDKIRGQLPRWIDQKLPGKRTPAGRTSGREAPCAQAFWFTVDGPFEEGDWRFFWVDDRGYESEVEHWHLTSRGEWLGVEGNVPRLQERLHLKVRSRKGEEQAMASMRTPDLHKEGTLGEVVAEMKFRNPLRRSEPPAPLTAQTLPAKVSMGEHQFILKGATRKRIASDPTYGLHLALSLKGQPSIPNLFELHDWTIEDGNGNVMTPGTGELSGPGQWWDCAPWSDSPVWKIHFVPVYDDPKHYTADEILTLDPMPMPVLIPLSKNRFQPVSWQCERSIKDHTIRFEEVKPMGPNEVTFAVTITPAVNGHSLQLLHATDEAGSQTGETRYGPTKYAMSLRLIDLGDTSTKLLGACRRPTTGNTLTVTLAFKKVTPVEFTFRPEFEP